MNLSQLIDRLIWDLLGVHETIDTRYSYPGSLVELYNPTIHNFKLHPTEWSDYSNNRFYLKLVYYHKRTFSTTGTPKMYSIILVDKMENRTYVKLHVNMTFNILHQALFSLHKNGDQVLDVLNHRYDRLKYNPQLLFKRYNVY